MSHHTQEQKGECCICGKETKHYCRSCSITWGEFTPTWYCEDHYKSVVLAGGCCSESENLYSSQEQGGR